MTLYNPASVSKESLIDNFIVRTRVFEKIFADLKKGNMKYPEQHYLIQGQRGMGKTTLLLRLKYEVENTPELKDWLIPVFFNEESYDLTSLSSLWEKLLKYLDDYFETNGKYYDYTEAFIDEADYEKKCFDYLIEILNSRQKKLVIFFDNFGQLFLDNLKDKEKRRLREILMSCNSLRIVGASAIILSDLHDYSEPFYEFFKIIPLEGLSKEESFQLITKLQEKATVKIDLKKNKAKIETLGILTGGVIRTLMMVYEVVLIDQDGSALRDLEMVLDKITPLYKHRIEDLPVQQRKIIDVIARQWDAISTKEIASQIRENGKPMSTKLISAQLQQLEKNNVIEKKVTHTKNHLYQVKERFFNIWYLMRNGDRKDKRKVKWLTKFLELWYDNETDLEGFLTRYIKCLRSGKYHPKPALLLSEALINSDKLDLMHLDSLVNETVAVLNEDQIKYLSNTDDKKRKVARDHYQNEEYKQAIEILKTISSKSSLDYLTLALCYSHSGDNSAAKVHLDSVNYIDIDNDGLMNGFIYCYLWIGEPYVALELCEQFKWEKSGLFYKIKGNIYEAINEKSKAISQYIKGAELNDIDCYRSLINNFVKEEDFNKAEYYLLKDGIINPVLIDLAVEFYMFYDNRSNAKFKAKNLLDKLADDKIIKNPDLIIMKALLDSFDVNNGYDLYPSTIKDFEKANKLYKKLGKSSKTYYLMLSLLSYYYIKEKNKKAAVALFQDYYSDYDYGLNFQLNKAFVSVWNSNYNEVFIDLKIYFNSDFSSNEYDRDTMNQLILLLLSRNQFHTALDLFSKIENLKEILKPTYYALMTFLKNEYPNEVLKMGKELEQPVNDVLKKIEEMKVIYK